MHRSYFGAFVCLLICCVCLPAAWARYEQTTLPAQLGPYPVNIKDFLLRTNRQDPWAETPQKRKLMLTVYKPDVLTRHCSKPAYLDYMPSKMAHIYDDFLKEYIPNGTMERLQLKSCAPPKIAKRWWERSPLLIFSPGLGSTRLMYGALVTAVASTGYTVVSIDHTYAAEAVQFPDGEVAIGNRQQLLNNITDPDAFSAEVAKMLPPHVDDVESVLAAIKAGQVTGLERYPNVKAGMFGHSMGGSTAAAIMVNESRVLGGMNYDAPYFGPAVSEGFDRPFLGLAEDFLLHGSDPSWDLFYSNLRGWKAEIAVNNTRHGTFTDLPLIEKALHIRERNETNYEEFFGSIDGQRAFDIVRKYTVTFFDFVLKGKDASLLEGNSTQYPEAILLKGSFDENITHYA